VRTSQRGPEDSLCARHPESRSRGDEGVAQRWTERKEKFLMKTNQPTCLRRLNKV